MHTSRHCRPRWLRHSSIQIREWAFASRRHRDGRESAIDENLTLVSFKISGCRLFHLVCNRFHFGRSEEYLEIFDSEIANTDAPDNRMISSIAIITQSWRNALRQSICFDFLHLRPGRGYVRLCQTWRVNEIEIYIFDSELGDFQILMKVLRETSPTLLKLFLMEVSMSSPLRPEYLVVM